MKILLVKLLVLIQLIPLEGTQFFSFCKSNYIMTFSPLPPPPPPPPPLPPLPPSPPPSLPSLVDLKQSMIY